MNDIESITGGSDPMLINIKELEQLSVATPGEQGAYLAGILYARLSLLAAGIE